VYAGRLEAGRFQQYRGRGVGNFGSSTAHHAGHGDGARGVGYNEGVGCQLALDVVEGAQNLAILRAADDDLAARYTAIIESVQRLSVLHHDEVGYVHYVVDGTHACGIDGFLQPVRRRADFNVRYQRGAVART